MSFLKFCNLSGAAGYVSLPSARGDPHRIGLGLGTASLRTVLLQVRRAGPDAGLPLSSPGARRRVGTATPALSRKQAALSRRLAILLHLWEARSRTALTKETRQQTRCVYLYRHL